MALPWYGYSNRDATSLPSAAVSLYSSTRRRRYVDVEGEQVGVRHTRRLLERLCSNNVQDREVGWMRQ